MNLGTVEFVVIFQLFVLVTYGHLSVRSGAKTNGRLGSSLLQLMYRNEREDAGERNGS